jgi:ABC-type enterobactin transport system permease subunit
MMQSRRHRGSCREAQRRLREARFNEPAPGLVKGIVHGLLVDYLARMMKKIHPLTCVLVGITQRAALSHCLAIVDKCFQITD